MALFGSGLGFLISTFVHQGFRPPALLRSEPFWLPAFLPSWPKFWPPFHLRLEIFVPRKKEENKIAVELFSIWVDCYLLQIQTHAPQLRGTCSDGFSLQRTKPRHKNRIFFRLAFSSFLEMSLKKVFLESKSVWSPSYYKEWLKKTTKTQSHIICSKWHKIIKS